MISSATGGYTYPNYAPITNREQGIVPAESLKSQPSIQIVDRSQTSAPASQNSNKPQSEQKDQNGSSLSQNKATAQTSSSNENEQAVQQVVNQLKARDSEVRAHEMAHLGAAGGYATSGASYAYQVGPDGKRYAIGGEVGIDISPVAGDPQATLQKAAVVQRAALAPAQPSSQDYRVASAAAQMAAQARMELTQKEDVQEAGAENDGDSDDSGSGNESSGDSSRVETSSRINESQSQMNSADLQASRNEFDLRLSFQRMA
ncbi:putative metalloprotease CJM1_0395 family protein [Thiomicrorhabdus sp. ZW0627]|uniref:putative metalloprotease CJM1_0395 family protein n=1 Tax=Thiomicrorhabdus sp. ZW0627 TaxID=3039774 RepID=UPI002436BE97|nr:putative metalloprotease CJM1_0395 family protein [Thiomicrorhabdus sp. ZW0627]MDG6773736.1 putative metalloprotease CJM1_0395 family protein [Thiomicrorhabdus sp. ZW0627]